MARAYNYYSGIIIMTWHCVVTTTKPIKAELGDLKKKNK